MIARMNANQWLRFEATVRRFCELKSQLKSSTPMPPLQETDILQTLAGLESQIEHMKAGAVPAEKLPIRGMRNVA